MKKQPTSVLIKKLHNELDSPEDEKIHSRQKGTKINVIVSHKLPLNRNGVTPTPQDQQSHISPD